MSFCDLGVWNAPIQMNIARGALLQLHIITQPRLTAWRPYTTPPHTHTHSHVPSSKQKQIQSNIHNPAHVNTARCIRPHACTRTQTDVHAHELAYTCAHTNTFIWSLWCGGCMMKMMMKAPLYYAACCHYPTLQTEPDRSLSFSTILAVNIHVIAQQQLSGKIRSVITEVNLSLCLQCKCFNERDN